MSSLVKTRLGKAVGVGFGESGTGGFCLGRVRLVMAVMSRFGFACCGVAVEASPDAARHGLVW